MIESFSFGLEWDDLYIINKQIRKDNILGFEITKHDYYHIGAYVVVKRPLV